MSTLTVNIFASISDLGAGTPSLVLSDCKDVRESLVSGYVIVSEDGATYLPSGTIMTMADEVKE